MRGRIPSGHGAVPLRNRPLGKSRRIPRFATGSTLAGRLREHDDALPRPSLGCGPMKIFLFRAVALSSALAVSPAVAQPAEQPALGIELAQETDWVPEAVEPSTPAPDELPPPPTAEAPGPDAYQTQ